MLLPDFALRYLVTPKVYYEPFVTVIPCLFNLAWICLFLGICLVLLPGKAGRLVFLIIGIMANTLSFSDYVYFRIFGRFFWLSSVGLVGEAKNYFDYALSYTDAKIIVVTVISLALLIAAFLKWKAPRRVKGRMRIMTAIPVLSLLILHVFMQPSVFGVLEDDWDSWSRPRVIYKQFTDINKSFDVAGLYQFVARDFWKTWFPTNNYGEEDLKKADEYFAARPEHTDNEYTGIFEGKNVIAVMMESMDNWMVTDESTPTIKYMMENGISFDRHFAPTIGTGYTFNTEFTFNTGFYTPKSAVTAVNFGDNSYPYALPRLFREKGYLANSFHYNNSEFYNRGIMHTAFGYEQYNSFMKFGLTAYAAQADSNILKNDEIYKKMTEGKPFFDFVITYSCHIPYNYDDAKLSLARANHPELVDPSMNEEKNNCLLLARDTDDFFKQLLERLDADGLLEDTVIIGFADHYAYGFSDQKLLEQYSREAGAELLRQVPAFIYNPQLKGVSVTKVTQTSDLLPTVLNLFGLENHGCYLGYDVFDPSYDGFAYFEDLSWYDGTTYYVPGQTETSEAARGYTEQKNREVSEAVGINDIVIAGDYWGKHTKTP